MSRIGLPRVLVVPGLYGSGEGHWQNRWLSVRPDCRRVELGSWNNPRRSHWLTKLDLAVAQEGAPVVLVAHSLGCLAVAWWVALAEADRLMSVAGAMLVAPPDVEQGGLESVLARFAPVPEIVLPFPSLVVASTNDPYASLERSRSFARAWGSQFLNVGAMGHINAQSGLGDWVEGQKIMEHWFDVPNQGQYPGPAISYLPPLDALTGRSGRSRRR